MIGMLLLPLNFLAFAIFTLGLPWDNWTVLGEVISLGVLGTLAWFAATVLTPRSIGLTTLTAIGFALSNLLIRRFISIDSQLTALYIAAIALSVFYLVPMLLGWREHRKKSNATLFAEPLRLLAIGTFGCLISFGLLVACSGDGWFTLHQISPLASGVAFPSMYFALNLQKAMPPRSRWMLLVVLIAAVALSFGMLSLVFAWPTPIWMALSFMGVAGLLLYLSKHQSHPSIAYAIYLIASLWVVLIYQVASSRILWNEEDMRTVWNALLSPHSGFALIGCSTAILAGAIAVYRNNLLEHGLVPLRSAWFVGIAGMITIGIFGIGRQEFAVSVSLIYLLYAISLMTVAAYRSPTYHDIVAGLLVIIAAIQSICFGWMHIEPWFVSGFWAMLSATIVFVAAVSLREYLVPSEISRDARLKEWMVVAILVATGLALIGLIASEFSSIRNAWSLSPRDASISQSLALASVWAVVAFTLTHSTYWIIAQLTTAIAGAIAVLEYSKKQDWFHEATLGILHPISIQWHLAWLICFSSVFLLLRILLNRTGESRRHWILERLSTIHRGLVARSTMYLALFGVVLMCFYGAVPGILQELMPRDLNGPSQRVSYELGGQSQSREVPALQNFAIRGFPHEAVIWSSQGISRGLAGMPRVLWIWAVALMGAGVLCWSRPTPVHRRLLVTVLMSILFPVASLWQSEIAVASVLRWLLGAYLVVGCVVMGQWHKSSAARVLHNDANIDLALTRAERLRKFDSLFHLLVYHAVIPLILMGTIVGVGSLARRQTIALDWMIWGVVGLLALVGLAFALTRGATSSRRTTLSVSVAWIFVSPLLGWLVLQVALGLMGHPLTGPNPDSLFVRMGLVTSYSIPILLIAIGLLVAATTRPSPWLSFLACQVLSASAMAGYMLALKSHGLKPASWIGLAALLCSVGGVYALLWYWYAHRRTVSDAASKVASMVDASELTQDRIYWQRCLQQISAGFLVCGLIGGMVLVFINGTALNHLAMTSAGMLVAVAITLLVSRYSRVSLNFAFWGLAFGALIATAAASWISDERTSVACGAMIMLATAAFMVVRARRDEIDSSWRWGFAIANAAANLLAIRELWEPNGKWLSIGLLILSSFASLAMAWRSGKTRTIAWSMVTAHLAGFVYSIALMPRGNGGDLLISTILLQIAISMSVCLVSSCFGLGTLVRVFVRVGVLVLMLLSFNWYSIALFIDVGTYRIGIFFAAILCSFLASIAGYWSRSSRDVDLLVYACGLCGVVCLMQTLDPNQNQLLWISTLLFAAYCLGSSFVWRASDRIRMGINRWGILPAIDEHAAATEVVVANTVLAMLVAWLGMAAQFHCENQGLRFASSQAIMAVALAVGFLARYKDLRSGFSDATNVEIPESLGTLAMRVIALAMGVLAAIALGWSFQNLANVTGLERIATASLSMSIMGGAYGFGLIKWVGLKPAWQSAALQLMPVLVVAVAGCTAGCLMLEREIEVVSSVTNVAIVLSILLAGALCVAAALLPGNDPFGLSEKGRTLYIYVFELLVVMLVVQLRLAMPWLFSGWIQRVWPILMVLLAFVGLAASELARRRRLQVLAEPLRRTGSMLPLLPVLAHWMVPSDVHYSVSLVCAAVAYGTFGYLGKSKLYWVASAFFANMGLWYLLRENDFSFAQHPQLWVIPPALCILMLVQSMRAILSRGQVAAARYMATSSIYVASTAELFMQGIADAPWMPIVLAGLSIVGILFGIGARIRALLWLGTVFLCVALFSIVWHAAVDLQQTWVWYATGLAMGVVILTMFALFEKRREELKKLVSSIQTWDD